MRSVLSALKVCSAECQGLTTLCSVWCWGERAALTAARQGGYVPFQLKPPDVANLPDYDSIIRTHSKGVNIRKYRKIALLFFGDGFLSFRPVERPEKSENWIFLKQVERKVVYFCSMRLFFMCFYGTDSISAAASRFIPPSHLFGFRIRKSLLRTLWFEILPPRKDCNRTF
jgi:hypothetical protein